MSGFMGVLLASGSNPLTGSAGLVTNTAITTGVRSGMFALVNDGTFTNTGHANNNWYNPTTAGIGTSWWAKATVNSSTNTTFSGSTGSWIQLTSGTSWGMTNSSSTVEGTGNFTIQFSPDGGSTVAGAMTVSWDVGYTP